MILRKPFAFLIKNFKLIHLVFVVLASYLVFKTSEILVFFTEYLQSVTALTGSELASNLVTPMMYGSIFLLMIGVTIVMALLKMKDKPIKFYIYSIVCDVLVLAIFLYSASVLQRLEVGLVEIKILELVRDFLVMGILLESSCLVWFIVRATGFDIKSFHFNEDLEGLEITEEDNEEFELDLELDKHVYTRKFRKFKRYLKYAILENKFLFTLCCFGVFSLILGIIYLNTGIYNKTLSQKEAFRTNEFAISIQNVYKTKYDYQLQQVDENSEFIIVKLKVRNLANISRKLNTGRITLIAGKGYFYHTIDFKDAFIDLGSSYNSEILGTKFQTYLLVFKIPESMKNKKMVLKYNDTNLKDIRIALKPNDLDEEKKMTQASLNEELTFEQSVLGKTHLTISEFALADQFKVQYKYCYTSSNCMDSYEYVKPTISDNHKKTLLKLVGSVSIDEGIAIPPISNLYKFMTYFGKLKYTIKGSGEKTMNVAFKRVLPLKTDHKDEYYIEVVDEIKNAESIKLEFTIRNKVYTYMLK